MNPSSTASEHQELNDRGQEDSGEKDGKDDGGSGAHTLSLSFPAARRKGDGSGHGCS
jgi:hypothetical protein